MRLAGRHFLVVALLAAAVAAISFSSAEAGRSERAILERLELKVDKLVAGLTTLEKRVDSLERYMHFNEKTDITTIRQEQKEKKGLRVLAKPQAKVYLDGKYVGMTPYQNYVLKNGRHRVTIKHPDYDPVNEVVVVRDREVQTVDISFRGTILSQ